MSNLGKPVEPPGEEEKLEKEEQQNQVGVFERTQIQLDNENEQMKELPQPSIWAKLCACFSGKSPEYKYHRENTIHYTLKEYYDEQAKQWLPSCVEQRTSSSTIAIPALSSQEQQVRISVKSYDGLGDQYATGSLTIENPFSLQTLSGTVYAEGKPASLLLAGTPNKSVQLTPLLTYHDNGYQEHHATLYWYANGKLVRTGTHNNWSQAHKTYNKPSK
jgi:hypothetical protein